MSTPSSSLLQRARNYLRIDSEQLDRVAGLLDDDLERVVESLAACRGKIICSGMGKSYHIGCKVAATFTSTGSPAVPLHPSEALHGDLGILQDGDCAILLSYSGSSTEVLQLVPFLRRRDVTLISVCGTTDNPLAALTDFHLCVNIEREACPFNLAPTTSALVTLAVCDTLAMLVQEQRGFTLEEYSQLHPGGAIGATLTMRIHDVMRSGDRLPFCTQDATLEEAIVRMTTCKSGAVVVVNADLTVLGIFTDGDLRRAFTQQRATNTSIAEVLTPSPVCLKESDDIQAALDVFSQRNIDDLVVVDDEGRLVGLVDLQDLPKLKLLQAQEPGQDQ